MYCKNCGKLLEEGDKFCSGCGTKVEEPAFAQSKPVQEAPKEAAEEKPKKKIHIEEFNWDLDGYPTSQKKTDDIDFNWASVLEEKQRRAYGQVLSAKPQELPASSASETEVKSLEDEIFGNLDKRIPGEGAKSSGNTENSGRIDKFYTFNKKNEAFQALLDEEYERIKNGEEPQGDESLAFARRDSISKEAVLERILEKSGGEPVSQKQEEEQQPSNLIGVMWAQTPEGFVTSEAASIAGLDKEKTAAAEESIPAAAEPSCPPSEEEPQAKPGAGHKLTFDDVFGPDDRDSVEKPKKKRKALKVIAIILCILVVLELAMIGIQHFAPDSAAGKMIDRGYQYVFDLFGGDDDKDKAKEEDSTGGDNGLSDTVKLIKANEDKNKNVAEITEDADLLFSDNKDYGYEDFGNSYTFADSPWYTDKDGTSVTYGNEIIGTIIQYYSSWIDMANGKNEKVLKFIDETSDFYTEIESMESKDGVQYGINKLAIGEIRSSGAGFYVLTDVTKVSSDKKKDTVEHHIVYLEPEKETMKIIEIKKI